MQDFDKFVARVKRTGELNPDGCQHNHKLMEEFLALMEEVGELAQLHKKNILYGKEINPGDVLSELGDVLHYLISIAQWYNFTLEEIIDYNIYKVEKKWASLNESKS